MKKAAASGSSRPAGAGRVLFAFMSAISANAPEGIAGPPITRSPTATPATPGRAVTTSPHSSTPGVYGSGGRTWYPPRHISTSGKFAAAPSTRTSS